MLMFYHSHTIDETLRDLHASRGGLRQEAAAHRLKEHGPNSITQHHFRDITKNPFSNSYLLVLILASGFSLAIDQKAVAALLAVVVIINSSLRFIQHRAHHMTLRRNAQLAGDTALVLRDGVGVVTPVDKIVPGDIISLHAGDHVPADGRVIHAVELYTKEYQLTGDEEPVAKQTNPVHSESELGHRTNMVYRGTHVTSGSGQYLVTATGDATAYGTLSRRIAYTTKRSTLQQKISSMTNRTILMSLGVAAAIMIINLGRGVAWYTAAEYAVVVIISAIPAMLPIIITIIASQGLSKLASQRALFASLRAIENTSMLTTLVTGRTNFITEATPSTIELWQPEGARASIANIISRSIAWHADERDTIDTALAKNHPPSATIRPAIQFLFDRRSHLSGNLWHYARHYELVIKGAPEKLLDIANVTENEREQIFQQTQRYTTKGHQVLAVARCKSDQVIASLSQLDSSYKLEFVGLVILKYNILPDARKFLRRLALAGITPRLASGDATDTSYILASQTGIASSRRQAIDTRRLAVMPTHVAQKTIRQAAVYARTSAATTTQVVTALKQHGVVGVTGDGPNDTPALSRSHIGITLKNSAALAHDASDIVLLSRANHLGTLYSAIQTSRSIIGNIRRVLFYTLTTNLAGVLIVITTLIFALPLALSAIQILWINIVLYTILVLGLAVEPDSRNIMKRRPVSPQTSLLPAYLGLRVCFLALTMALVTAVVFTASLQSHDLVYAQALAFHAFAVMQIASALAARSDHTSLFIRFRTWSPAVYTGILCAIGIHIAIMLSPLGQWLVGTTVQPNHLFYVTLIALVTFILVSELTKVHSRRTVRKREEKLA